MPEAIISASGVQHGLIINPDGSINSAISGGIHIGSVSANVDSIYIQSGANIVGSAYVYQKTNPWEISGTVGVHNVVGVTPSGTFAVETTVDAGSEAYTYGKSGADYYPLLVESGADGGILRTTATVTVGSESWVKEVPKTEVYGSGTFEVIGEFSTGSESFIPAGSVIVTNLDEVVVTTGSEAVVTAGSIQTYTQLGSVEVWQQTASDLVTNANVTNFGDLGSSVTQGTAPWVISGVISNLDEVVVTTGSEAVVTAGSIQTYSQLGSVEVWQDTNTDLQVQATQETSPWVISGNVMISGVISNLSEISVTVGSEAVVTAGSIQTYSQLGSVEVWQTTAGDLTVDIGDIGSVRAILDNPVNVGSYTTQTVDGTVGVSSPATIGSYTLQKMAGSVYQSTDPWIISGVISNLSEVSVTVGSESVITAGSVQPYSQLGSVEIWQTTAADLTVSVDSPASIGSYTTQTVDGTITVTDIATAGSLALQDVSIDTPEAVGSLAIQTVDGTVAIDDFGDLGSSRVIANFGDLGSTVVIDSPATIGSYTTQTVDGTVTVTGIATAGSLAVQDVDIGNFGDLGSAVTQGTVPWVISGEVTHTGSINVYDFTTNLIQRIDYEDKNQPVYLGLANPGTATSTGGWQLRKNVFSGTSPELVVAILFGSGNINFDKTWDNRSGTDEVYS